MRGLARRYRSQKSSCRAYLKYRPAIAPCVLMTIWFSSERLRRARDYLHEHAECVCVDGIYLNFLRLESDLHVKIEYASEGIEPNHPCARVFRLFQRYESLFYGVFRTPDLLHIFSGVSRIPTLHYQELFQATAALLIGKSHRLDKIYAGRQHCDPAEPSRDKWQTYYWFAENRVELLDHYCVSCGTGRFLPEVRRRPPPDP